MLLSLKNIFDEIVKSVHFFNSRPLSTFLFYILRDEMESAHKALSLCIALRCWSQGKVLK